MAYLMRDNDNDARWFVSGIVGIATFLILTFSLGCIGSERVTTRTTEIVAISDGSATSGSFFLGCGSIEEIQYYFIYVVNEDGSFEQRKYPVNDCKIVEDANVTPYIRTTKMKMENIMWAFFRAPVIKYVFVVPNMTVSRDFTLDLE